MYGPFHYSSAHEHFGRHLLYPVVGSDGVTVALCPTVKQAQRVASILTAWWNVKQAVLSWESIGD